jgi:hypothetical protein
MHGNQTDLLQAGLLPGCPWTIFRMAFSKSLPVVDGRLGLKFSSSQWSEVGIGIIVVTAHSTLSALFCTMDCSVNLPIQKV